MKRIVFYSITILSTLIFFGCSSSSVDKKKMAEMVQKHIQCNLTPNNKLTKLEISEPDSTYGVLCLPQEQLEYIAKSIDNLSNHIMKRTSNMQDFSKVDTKTAYLANKQMQASAYAADLFAYSQMRNKFNGWYIRAKFTVTYGKNVVQIEKWFFFNKEGDIIYNTFELPIP